MDEHIVPECYFDTVLVKAILQRKNINHQKTCYKVESVVRAIDDFAVGIIDKDKRELGYLKECIIEISHEHLILWKHRAKQHYFIQLVPAIEIWILNASKECNLNLEEFGMRNDLESLKQFTKHKTASENENLRNLCKILVNSDSQTIKTLSKWLKYLFNENRNADISILRQL
jgi:hypothetical protein